MLCGSGSGEQRIRGETKESERKDAGREAGGFWDGILGILGNKYKSVKS